MLVAATMTRTRGGGDRYVTWDHPNMPWDATRLMVVALADDGAPASADTAAHATVAGADGDTSVLQPAWSPATGERRPLQRRHGRRLLAG